MMSCNSPENCGKQLTNISPSLRLSKFKQWKFEMFEFPHFIHNFLNLLPSIKCINNFDRSTSVKEERGEEGSTVGREGKKEGGRQAVGGWVGNLTGF